LPFGKIEGCRNTEAEAETLKAECFEAHRASWDGGCSGEEKLENNFQILVREQLDKVTLAAELRLGGWFD
jgi:hypothetical protein